MNSDSGMNDNYKKDITKATAAIPMVVTIVTAALLVSGLSFISSYQPAIAQQNMTGAGNATNATMAGAGNATNATMAGAGNATNATMAGAGNATNATEAAGGALSNATEAAGGALSNATGEAAEGGGSILEGIFGGGGG
jgi:hypothetical protein